MTLAIDVNPLVYASDVSSPFHVASRDALAEIMDRRETLYLFWTVAVGYVRVATSSRVHRTPLSTAEALDNVQALLARPNVRTSIEAPRFWSSLSEACLEVRAEGNLVTDAYLVALMRQHEVRRILTHDRDFRKFDGIDVVDPFQ
jgi:toxin-antitoxin system PIN domain toxin